MAVSSSISAYILAALFRRRNAAQKAKKAISVTALWAVDLLLRAPQFKAVTIRSI
jgi:hypothetical protein